MKKFLIVLGLVPFITFAATRPIQIGAGGTGVTSCLTGEIFQSDGTVATCTDSPTLATIGATTINATTGNFNTLNAGTLNTTLGLGTGNANIVGDLQVNGGDIGISTDTNLMQLTNNRLTVNGDVTSTSFTIGANTLTTSEFGFLDGQDQVVGIGDSPTFTGTNITGVPASSVLAGTFGTGSYVIDTKLTTGSTATLNTEMIQVGNPDLQGQFITNLATATGGISIDRTDGAAYNALHFRRSTSDFNFEMTATNSLKITPELSTNYWEFMADGDFMVADGDYLLADEFGVGTATIKWIFDDAGDISTAAKVGIGTLSPVVKLDVRTLTTAGELTALRLTHGGGAVGDDVALEFLGGGGVLTVPAKIVVEATGSSDQEMAFYSVDNGVASEAMRIDDEGNVGIGTTPTSKLTINTPTTDLSASNTMHLVGTNGTVGAIIGIDVNTDDLVIENNDHAGLNIISASNRNAIISLRDKDAAGGFLSYVNSTANLLIGTAGVTSITIDSSQNVGIKDSTPDATLDVGGELRADGVAGDGTGKVVCIKSDGDFGTCSDAPNGSGVCTCS